MDDQTGQIPNIQNKLGFMLFSFPSLSSCTEQFIEIAGFEPSAWAIVQEIIQKNSGKTGQTMLERILRPWIFAKSKIPDQHERNGINLPFGWYIISDQFGHQNELFLYRTLAPSGRNFLISDLEMPVEIRGVIGIIETSEIRLEDASHEGWKEISKRLCNDIRESPVAWARWNKLPFTIVLLKETDDMPMISIDDVREIYDLAPDIPIIDCPSGLNHENIDEILRTTLNYIKP